MMPQGISGQLRDAARLVRWPNLLIAAITQLLLYWWCLLPAYRQAELLPRLDGPHFMLLVLCTLLLAAGSYLINDLYDVDTDRINKPERALAGLTFSIPAVRKAYVRTSIYGLAIAIYLSWHVGNGALFWLYPAAWGLLWAYARYFKCMVLAGNVIVALFCALVAGILLVAEAPRLILLSQQAPELAEDVYGIFILYMVFAFLSTLYRELVKDIEDVPGDRAANCQTLPVAWGTHAARSLSTFLGLLLVLLLMGLVLWLWKRDEPGAALMLAFGSAAPASYSIWLILQAREASDFRRISQLAKIVMLGGLLLILFL